ncbi:hypothetical protein EV1_042885 [Malus domestica]
MTLPAIPGKRMLKSDITISELQLVLTNSYRQDFSVSQDFDVEPTPPAIPRERMLQSGIAISDLQLVLTRLPQTDISKTCRFQVTPTLLAIPRECTSQNIVLCGKSSNKSNTSPMKHNPNTNSCISTRI